MPSESSKELEALLEKIRRLRESLYPPGWKYDPLYEVERELARIIEK